MESLVNSLTILQLQLLNDIGNTHLEHRTTYNNFVFTYFRDMPLQDIPVVGVPLQVAQNLHKW